MTQRQVNVKLLVWLLGGLFLFGLGVHLLHGFQVQRQANSFLAQAAEAENRGDFQQAASHFKQYLVFSPNDTSAVIRYAFALEKSPKSVPDRSQVPMLLEYALVREPTRQDLRRHLLDLYLEMEATGDARRHLQALMQVQKDNGELEGILARCLQSDGELDAAAGMYQQALSHAPEQIDSYVRLAELWRQLNRPDRARLTMEDLIQANPQSFKARLEHALCLIGAGSLDEAEADLEQAGKIEPDSPQLLRAQALLAQGRGRIEEARAAWQQALEREQRQLNLYLGLASLELGDGRPAEAAAVCRRALVFFPDHQDLLYLLTEAYLAVPDLKPAEEMIARLKQNPDLSAVSGYLLAQVQMHRQHWSEAVRSLDAALPQANSTLAARILVGLGRCYEQMGENERALNAYRQAVERLGSWLPARLSYGLALLSLGKAEQAQEQLRPASRLPGVPDQVWLLLGRAQYLRNLALPLDKRRWDDVDQAIEKCRGNATLAGPLAILRADEHQASQEPAEARQVLDQALQDRPKDIELWAARARLAAQQGDMKQAHTVLAGARERTGDSARIRQVEIELDTGPASLENLRRQEKAIAGFAAADKDRLLFQIARRYYQLGQAAEGNRIIKELARRPETLEKHLSLLDLATQGGDDALLEQLTQELRTLEEEKGTEGVYWRYGEAVRQVLRVYRGDRSAMAKANKQRAEIVKRRGGWARAAVLEGHLEELAGRPDKALASYQRAFDAGERQPALVLHLTRQLIERGRDAEADRIYRQFQQQVVLEGELARLAAEVAYRLRTFDRAVDLARKATPVEQPDFRYLLWYGQILSGAGRADEAVEVLRQAQALRPDLPDCWTALVAQLGRMEQIQEADRLLAELPGRMPAELVPLTRAVCLEALGRFQPASEHYALALGSQPYDGKVLQRAASFFLRIYQPERAEKMLRRLLDPTSLALDENQAWARRQLALIRAFQGEEADYAEAQKLLEANRKRGDSLADRRAGDMVRATRPDQRRAALQALEATLPNRPLSSEEQIWLVQLYDRAETLEDWSKARDLMLELISHDPQNSEHLAYFIHSLLRRGKKDEARPWISRLSRLEGESPRVREFRETR